MARILHKDVVGFTDVALAELNTQSVQFDAWYLVAFDFVPPVSPHLVCGDEVEIAANRAGLLLNAPSLDAVLSRKGIRRSRAIQHALSSGCTASTDLCRAPP